MDNKFDLTAFRQEFLISDEGWGVSDCYKPYDDKFLRGDAQDAYEGAKWAWEHQQAKVEELQKQLIDQSQKFNEQAQRVKDLEHKNGELQKRVDAALARANQACIGNEMFHKQFDDVIRVLRGE